MQGTISETCVADLYQHSYNQAYKHHETYHIEECNWHNILLNASSRQPKPCYCHSHHAEHSVAVILIQNIRRAHWLENMADAMYILARYRINHIMDKSTSYTENLLSLFIPHLLNDIKQDSSRFRYSRVKASVSGDRNTETASCCQSYMAKKAPSGLADKITPAAAA